MPTISEREMGIVFGITGTQEPAFKTLLSKSGPFVSNYEVRLYTPYFIAEVAQVPGEDNNSFGVLAKYIGVFGEPANVSKAPMAMTAPVITVPRSERMAMTSPVISGSGGEAMSFVLPFNFKRIQDVPVPTDRRVTIKTIPRRVLAVKKFSGWYSQVEGRKHLEELKSSLAADKIIPDSAANVQWSVAQYHPPFTLPFMRRNEIWVELDERSDRIKQLIAEAGADASDDTQK